MSAVKRLFGFISPEEKALNELQTYFEKCANPQFNKDEVSGIINMITTNQCSISFINERKDDKKFRDLLKAAVDELVKKKPAASPNANLNHLYTTPDGSSEIISHEVNPDLPEKIIFIATDKIFSYHQSTKIFNYVKDVDASTSSDIPIAKVETNRFMSLTFKYVGNMVYLSLPMKEPGNDSHDKLHQAYNELSVVARAPLISPVIDLVNQPKATVRMMPPDWSTNNSKWIANWKHEDNVRFMAVVRGRHASISVKVDAIVAGYWTEWQQFLTLHSVPADIVHFTIWISHGLKQWRPDCHPHHIAHELCFMFMEQNNVLFSKDLTDFLRIVGNKKFTDCGSFTMDQGWYLAI